MLVTERTNKHFENNPLVETLSSCKTPPKKKTKYLQNDSPKKP